MDIETGCVAAFHFNDDWTEFSFQIKIVAKIGKILRDTNFDEIIPFSKSPIQDEPYELGCPRAKKIFHIFVLQSSKKERFLCQEDTLVQI